MDRFEEHRVTVLGISADAPEDSAALAERIGDRIPLLSDRDLAVAKAYGVVAADRDIAVPATFLIAPDRTIALRYVGESVPDRPSVERLLEAAERIR